MRVGIIDNLPDGGAKRLVSDQVKLLSPHYQVYYAGPRGKFHFDPARHAFKSKQFDLSIKEFKSFKRPFTELQLATNLRQKYQKAIDWLELSGIDLLLAHPDRYTQAPYATTLTRTPTLYYVEEWLRIFYEPHLHPLSGIRWGFRQYEWLRRKFLAQIDRRNGRASHLILANSAFTGKHAEFSYRKKARVVYPGVDIKRFNKIKMSKKFFLYIGSRESVDGYPLIRALLDMTPKLNVKVVNMHEKFVSEKELIKLYNQAHAVLCLAHDEPFGLTAIESMACGTPVISISEGGYLETIVDGKTGFLVERSVDALATKMKLIKSNEKLADNLGALARKHVVKNFSLEHHQQNLIQIIESLS